MSKLLDKINCPSDLRRLSMGQLAELAGEVREHIINSVSVTGGHLASNLGIVEVTIAMHYVFDFASDKLLWDVGHQCYAHKILTGRKDKFDGLRKRDGLSGFPCPDESCYDPFSVGHAGTSIATALGVALGAAQNGTDEKVVALVGDASIVNGGSFEALNNLGLLKRQMLVVLNDNSMAIDKTQGGIAKFLSNVRFSHTYEDIRRTTENILDRVPVIGKRMENAIHKFTKAVRMSVSPSKLFESMDIPYFGPVDGHDIASLIKVFTVMSEFDSPGILHVYTEKGKGYSPAGKDPRKFHSTGPFEVNGKTEKVSGGDKTFTTAFGEGIVSLAENDKDVIAITAAMTDGTGLFDFRENFGDRFYDVGIAESVAVDVAAGLAIQGKKPFVCIYSTFLQRGYDQMFQEVSLQNLPVNFCIDRAGCVGNDGPTHHGLLDIGYIRSLPNMVVIAPANEAEMKTSLVFAANIDKPVAIRYPKDSAGGAAMDLPPCREAYELGKSVIVRQGESDVVLVAFGSVLKQALEAAEVLAADGISVEVVNARFAKPVDERIVDLAMAGKTVVTIEDHSVACGFGAAVLELAAAKAMEADRGGASGKIVTLGAGDEFIKAASRAVQLDEINVSADRIAETVRQIKS